MVFFHIFLDFMSGVKGNVLRDSNSLIKGDKIINALLRKTEKEMDR